MFISKKELKGLHDGIRDLNWKLAELRRKVEILECGVACVVGVSIPKLHRALNGEPESIPSIPDLDEKIGRLASEIGVTLVQRPAQPATYTVVPKAPPDVIRR